MKEMIRDEMIEDNHILVNGKYIPLSEYHKSVPEPLPPKRHGYKLRFRIRLEKITKILRRLYGFIR